MLRVFRFRAFCAFLIVAIAAVGGAGTASALSTKVRKQLEENKKSLASGAVQDPKAALSDKREEGKMTLSQAIVLGVVEGVTEYLPVSSTGHLLLAQKFMGIGDGLKSGESEENEKEKEAADAYAICIQAGAIIAVLLLYFGRVREMVKGLYGKSPGGLRMVYNVSAGFIPAAVIGLIFNKAIKSYLFGPWPVVAAWFIGGVAILAVGWRRSGGGRRVLSGKSLDELRVRMALMIGFAQCLAMWPGVSRSLATIVGGLVVGLSMSAAVEFSFLLGLVTLGAATAYDALKHGHLMLQMYNASALSLGLAVAFASAVVTVKWMISYLNKHGMALFGYYRVALALLVAALLMTRIL